MTEISSAKKSEAVVKAAMLACLAEKKLRELGEVVLNSRDLSEEITEDEIQFQNALVDFTNRYQAYEALMSQCDVNAEAAKRIYKEAQLGQSPATIIIEEFHNNMLIAIEDLPLEVETDSMTTSPSEFSLSSDEHSDVEPEKPVSVATLRARFESTRSNRETQPFKERSLPGKNVTSKVNVIEAREYLRKMRDDEDKAPKSGMELS